MINFVDMPTIDLAVLKEKLSPEAFELAKGIVATRGKNKGLLRASKPKTAKMVKMEGGRFGFHYDYANEEDAKTGMTAYIWRHVAFMISPLSTHQCMPVMDFCDLPGEYNEEQKQLAEKLEQIASDIVDTVPVEQWYGVQRWRGLV